MTVSANNVALSDFFFDPFPGIATHPTNSAQFLTVYVVKIHYMCWIAYAAISTRLVLIGTYFLGDLSIPF